MPDHFVCELDMFSKLFPARDRAAGLLFETWEKISYQVNIMKLVS